MGSRQGIGGAPRCRIIQICPKHLPALPPLSTPVSLDLLRLSYSIFAFLATTVVALALSTGLVPIEHTINLVRQRISSSVPKGEIHGHAGPQVRIGQPSTPQV